MRPHGKLWESTTTMILAAGQLVVNLAKEKTAKTKHLDNFSSPGVNLVQFCFDHTINRVRGSENHVRKPSLDTPCFAICSFTILTSAASLAELSFSALWMPPEWHPHMGQSHDFGSRHGYRSQRQRRGGGKCQSRQR